MESTCISSSTSLDDRTELVHGELYLEMKKNCILTERMIQRPVIRMCLMKDWHQQRNQGKKEGIDSNEAGNYESTSEIK